MHPSLQKVKHHNRRLSFRFHMYEKIKIICVMPRMIFRSLPVFTNRCTFSNPFPLLERDVGLLHGRSGPANIIKSHSVIQRRSRLKLYRSCSLLRPNPGALLTCMLAHQLGIVFHSPYPSPLQLRKRFNAFLLAGTSTDTG